MMRWLCVSVLLSGISVFAGRLAADVEVPEGSHSSASAGIGLETGTYSAPSAAQELETRYRTFDFGVQETDFKSTKPSGLFIMIR